MSICIHALGHKLNKSILLFFIICAQIFCYINGKQQRSKTTSHTEPTWLRVWGSGCKQSSCRPLKRLRVSIFLHTQLCPQLQGSESREAKANSPSFEVPLKLSKSPLAVHCQFSVVLFGFMNTIFTGVHRDPRSKGLL